jgi:hypothetical protein
LIEWRRVVDSAAKDEAVSTRGEFPRKLSTLASKRLDDVDLARGREPGALPGVGLTMGIF